MTETLVSVMPRLCWLDISRNRKEAIETTPPDDVILIRRRQHVLAHYYDNAITFLLHPIPWVERRTLQFFTNLFDDLALNFFYDKLVWINPHTKNISLLVSRTRFLNDISSLRWPDPSAGNPRYTMSHLQELFRRDSYTPVQQRKKKDLKKTPRWADLIHETAEHINRLQDDSDISYSPP